MVEITVHNTYGALIVGICIAIFLFGMITMQTLDYLTNFREDRPAFKLMVTGLWYAIESTILYQEFMSVQVSRAWAHHGHYQRALYSFLAEEISHKVHWLGCGTASRWPLYSRRSGATDHKYMKLRKLNVHRASSQGVSGNFCPDHGTSLVFCACALLWFVPSAPSSSRFKPSNPET
jgi:hypothetical protein